MSRKPVVGKPSLPPPTHEQQVAIDTLLHTNDNLIIDAMAGSGKTTTILRLAQASPDTSFLVLVYNRRLMIETQERANSLTLTNLVIMNYHVLGSRYYTPECATDQGLKRIVEDDMHVLPGKTLPDFEVLVMDEQQDMTPILKRFVDKLLCDTTHVLPYKKAKDSLRVVVLGDRRQELYVWLQQCRLAFPHAGRAARDIWLHQQEPLEIRHSNDLVSSVLEVHHGNPPDSSISNRLTQPVADLINSQVIRGSSEIAIKTNRLLGQDAKPLPRPRYTICNPACDIIFEVQRLLKISDITPQDILILAPSVRDYSPAIPLANQLAIESIPIFRSDSDMSEVAPDVAKGKILVCTYHQAKGIERQACIVLGFDASYQKFKDKNSEPVLGANNAQYVAVTRAREHLVLVQDVKNEPLPFINMETLHETCDVIRYSSAVHKTVTPETDKTPKYKPFGTTNLIRNVSETLLTKCLHHVEIIQIQEPAYIIDPSTLTEVSDKYGLTESVAAITGSAIPSIFQWRYQKRLSIVERLAQVLKSRRPSSKAAKLRSMLPPQYLDKLNKILRRYEDALEVRYQARDTQAISTPEIIFLGALEMSKKSQDIVSLLALPLDGYQWLNETHALDVVHTLQGLPDTARLPRRYLTFENAKAGNFKNVLTGEAAKRYQGVLLIGEPDILHNVKGTETSTIWEIKHSQSFRPQDVLQTALYMLLVGSDCSGFLVSTLTGQVEQVIPKTADSLHEILKLLVAAKMEASQSRMLRDYTDDEFLAESRNDFANLVGPCALPASFAARPTKSRYQLRGVKARKSKTKPVS